MTERVETIRLTATVANYISGMQQAQRATLATATASQKLAAQGAAMTNLGHTLLLFGTAVAAGVALAVKEFADFDAQMAQIKTLSHATSEEMDQLAKSAENLGQKIGITASEAADAELELVKAGISVKDILGGALQGSLQLAAAGQIDVAQATEIATIALTQFGLKGKDVPHVADELAAGADKALGSVGDLGEALKSGGLVASQFGLSLDDTVGVLGAFANAGLLGETAGTDLRQMLLKLANPSADSTATMKQLGIEIYNTSGKFVGITNLAGQLHDKLIDQTEAARNTALATIFGSRAIAGANVLYKEGAVGIGDWIKNLNDSGFAAHQAAGKMDNLEGDVSKLGAAFQKDLIQTGGTANDVLRESVQILTGLVRSYGDLPAPVQGTVLALGAAVAAAALLSGGFLTLVPKIAATKVALEAMNQSGKSAAIGLGSAALAVTAVTIVLTAFADYQAKAKETTSDLQGSLDQATGAVTKYTRSILANAVAQDEGFQTAKKAGVSQAEFVDAVVKGGSALEDVKGKLLAYGETTGDTGNKAYTLAGVLVTLHDNLKSGQKDWADTKLATDATSDSTDSAATAYQNAATQAQNLNDQIAQLVDQINTANGVGQDAITTNASYQKALSDVADYIDKAKKGVDGYTLTLDEHTAAGSANLAMLADLAKKNEDAAKAQFGLDGDTKNYVATLQAGHDSVVANAEALGATADQAQAIADNVAGIPTEAEIAILVDTVQATQSITDLEKKFGTLNAAAAAAGARYAGEAAAYANKPRHAAGGFTSSGAHLAVVGEKGSEFVLTHDAVTRPANVAAARFMNAGGTIPGFAGGGWTGPAVSAGGGGMALHISLPVTDSFVGTRDEFVKYATGAIRDGLKSGLIGANWQVR